MFPYLKFFNASLVCSDIKTAPDWKLLCCNAQSLLSLNVVVANNLRRQLSPIINWSLRVNHFNIEQRKRPICGQAYYNREIRSCK